MALIEENSTHVLLADDDDDDYMVFSLAIEELPIAVILTRAPNGEVLMEILSEKHPDILFLDLNMPCKDGRQCIREIRANPKFDSLPVIIYTSIKHMQDIELTYREGSNLYVVKPSNLSDLKNVLNKILLLNWKELLYYPTKEDFVLGPG